MEDKHNSVVAKLSHFDLTDQRYELEDIFDTVIGKLPDLYLPSSYRLAGEEDHFNKTRSMRLVPFRKQAEFDAWNSVEAQRCEASNHRCELIKLNISKGDVLVPEERKFPGRSDGRKGAPGNEWRLKVSFKAPESKENHSTSHHTHLYRGETERKSGQKSKSSHMIDIKHEEECKRKLKLRDELNRHYSKFRIRKKNERIDSGYETSDYQSGFNRLFRDKPDADYPFANPIAECMLTDENIDNLREIIVSSTEIEWKMLTPVRPDNEYEEKFFDKLIILHRNRYKTRLACGYFKNPNQRCPFKHTRHAFLVQCGDWHSQGRYSALKANDETGSLRGRYGKLLIPTLTLTEAEMKQDEPIMNGSSTSSGDRRRSNSAASSKSKIKDVGLDGGESEDEDEYIDNEEDLYHEYNYEYYSRFSRRNLQNLSERRRSKKLTQKSSGFQNQQSLDDFKQDLEFLQGGEDALEDQVEEIMNHLMSTNLTGGIK